MTGILRAWGISRGERQESESTKELATLLTTTESKRVQDKYLSITLVFTFTYRRKAIKYLN